MKFAVGQSLMWWPLRSHEPESLVTVASLKRGGALLSNGWVVDEDGIAEGTARQPGGFVRELAEQAAA